MTTVRIATFNVENLFARFKFKSNVKLEKVVKDGWLPDKTKFDIFNPTEKKITASALKATGADILALQEVENLDTLKRFRNDYLGGRKVYPHAVAIDGNDPRLIDVAVLSKKDFPLLKVRTFQHLLQPNGKNYIFSRDCLKVDVGLPEGKILTLYINHFKSMLDKKNPCQGRQKTRAKRELQAQTVKQIVIESFGPNPGDHPFVILGDLNDYLEADAQGMTAIDGLVGWDQVVNVVDRLPQDERWTHFFKGNTTCGIPASHHQLDYLLLSHSLAQANAGLPEIIRKGMPKRAFKYTGPRFAGVGLDEPKASDHCPVVMELNI